MEFYSLHPYECFCLAFLPLPGDGHALLTTLPVSPNQAHGKCRMSAGYEQFADFLREKCISFFLCEALNSATHLESLLLGMCVMNSCWEICKWLENTPERIFGTRCSFNINATGSLWGLEGAEKHIFIAVLCWVKHMLNHQANQSCRIWATSGEKELRVRNVWKLVDRNITLRFLLIYLTLVNWYYPEIF